MKKIVLFIICICASLFANAQAPTFQWAKGMGDNYNDKGKSIAIDTFGNVYSTGYFAGTVDFDPGVGIFNLTSAGGQDIYISKLDASGNFIWAKEIGGLSTDEGTSIVLDAVGNVYTTGYFVGTADFDPGVGIFNLSSSGSIDIFILKLDTAGNFIWAKDIGGAGTSNGEGNSIALDASDNVYIIGDFQGTIDFNPGVGTFNITSAGFMDIFISKLDASGNFVWAKKFGGSSQDNGFSILVDATGNIYSTGYFNGTVDFDPGAGIVDLTDPGCGSVFILKLDTSGNFILAKSMGGAGGSSACGACGQSIAIDASENIYTTGSFGGTVDFDPGAGIANIIAAVGLDIFISKLDASGNFVWAKNMGGTSSSGFLYDGGNSIAIDALGNVYTTGQFHDTVDFDPGTGTFNLNSTGGDDIFISKLDASGNFIWANNMGGTLNDGGSVIAVDGTNNVYVTGYFSGTADFDPGTGIFNLTSDSTSPNIFVLKLSQTPTGITENTNSNNISIYPNPSNGQFNIVVSSPQKNCSIEIYNSLGALVYSQKIVSEQNIIELTNQANGLYFVKMMSDGEMVGTKKIVKE